MGVFNGKNQVIWTLRVKLPQIQSECVRVIEIKSTATFLELHEAIQDAVDFDNDHLFEFFIGRHPGNRAYTIGGEPNWDTFSPVRTYRNVRISKVWPLPTGIMWFKFTGHFAKNNYTESEVFNERETKTSKLH